VVVAGGGGGGTIMAGGGGAGGFRESKSQVVYQLLQMSPLVLQQVTVTATAYSNYSRWRWSSGSPPGPSWYPGA
jgi:hypothetical protein